MPIFRVSDLLEDLHRLRRFCGFEDAAIARVEPIVLRRIVQGYRVEDELHVATGIPDWSFQLDAPGLRFAPFDCR
ncbi:MAG: hypothetical protein U1E63_15910 [Burkholderiales bacterium]